MGSGWILHLYIWKEIISKIIKCAKHQSLRFWDEEGYYWAPSAILLVQETYLRCCDFLVFIKDTIKYKIIKIFLANLLKGELLSNNWMFTSVNVINRMDLFMFFLLYTQLKKQLYYQPILFLLCGNFFTVTFVSPLSHMHWEVLRFCTHKFLYTTAWTGVGGYLPQGLGSPSSVWWHKGCAGGMAGFEMVQGKKSNMKREVWLRKPGPEF